MELKLENTLKVQILNAQTWEKEFNGKLTKNAKITVGFVGAFAQKEFFLNKNICDKWGYNFPENTICNIKLSYDIIENKLQVIDLVKV